MIRSFRRSLDQIRFSKRLQDAIVVIEDSRFYEHSGIDFRGLARALWQNIRSRNLTEQGGSTLTQQLARQIYLSGVKTMSRKVKETMLAVQIERKMDFVMPPRQGWYAPSPPESATARSSTKR